MGYILKGIDRHENPIYKSDKCIKIDVNKKKKLRKISKASRKCNRK